MKKDLKNELFAPQILKKKKKIDFRTLDIETFRVL